MDNDFVYKVIELNKSEWIELVEYKQSKQIKDKILKTTCFCFEFGCI